jgi:hypothetical protein
MRALAAIVLLAGTLSSARAGDMAGCRSQLGIGRAAGACSGLLATADRPIRTDPDEFQKPATILTGHLYAGRVAEAEKQLLRYVTAHPADQEGFYALGAARFLGAIERLGQSLHRHGLQRPGGEFLAPGLPFLRFPVPSNPAPENLTYDKARAILQTFITDLAAADASLSRVDAPNVSLPLNLGLVRLDLDSDGTAGPEEALWQVFAKVSSLSIQESQARQFLLRFDAGDAAWMRGYSHLLRAMSEFLLAHDWREGFERAFHQFFPGSGMPYAQLDELLRRHWDEYRKCLEAGGTDCRDRRPGDRSASFMDPQFGLIADLLAFIHLAHWPVVEPGRMARVLDHLETVVAMSRQSWRLILAETDDDHEWIPNPLQTGMLPGMRIDRQIIDGWLGFMSELDGMLQGRILLGHWRLARGINLRRVFLEPTTFDPILWAQGSAALPYLEEGPLARSDTWRRLQQIFAGDFFRYAVWLN